VDSNDQYLTHAELKYSYFKTLIDHVNC